MPARTSLLRRATATAVAATLSAGVSAALVAAPTAALADTTVLQDSFDRSVLSGWGTTGSSEYAVSDSTAFSVDGASGVVRIGTAGKRHHTDVRTTDLRDGTVSTTFTPDKPAMGWGQTFSLVQRRQVNGEAYEARLRVQSGGALFLAFVRRDSRGQEVAVGSERALTLAADQQALVAAGGTGLHLTFAVSGGSPASLQAKAWVHGQTSPANWQHTATDGTRRLGGFGSAGISTNTSTSTTNLPLTIKVDRLSVVDRTTIAPLDGSPMTVPRYGALPLGAATYGAPANARFVAPGGRDDASGTVIDPFATLGAATVAAPSGSTIVLRSGTYRESVSYHDKKLTIQNYPGEKATLSGSDPISSFTPDNGDFRVDGWTARFTRGGRPDLVDPARPLAAYPDMVFVDGAGQTQVADRASVVPGTFYVDYAASKLFLGSDPTGRTVEGSTRSRGLYLNRADGSAVRGIGLVRYANHPNDLGALLSEGNDSLVENVVVAQNASVGLSVLGKRTRVLNTTENDNGQIGLHANQADGLQVRRNLLQHNNTERFAMTGAQGNLKVTTSEGVTIADNLSRFSKGRGLWIDVNSYDVALVRNVVTDNADRGLQVEISGAVVVTGNLFANNGADGVSVIASNKVDIFHNSFWNNTRAVFVVADDRQRADVRIPQTVQQVALRNNVFSGTRRGTFQIVATEDVTRTRSAATMSVTTDSNAYGQPASGGATFWTGWADYPGIYQVFRSLGEYTTATGQEQHGLGVTGESFFTDPAGGDFSVKSGVGLGSVDRAALPARVADALGVTVGDVLPMGAVVTDTAAS